MSQYIFGLGGIVNSGTFNGSGGQQTYNIPHGMIPAPDYAVVQPGSPNAAHSGGTPLSFHWTIDSTNIAVTYNVVTPAGTITLHWIAGRKYSVRDEIHAVIYDTISD